MICADEHFKLHLGKSEEVLRQYPDNFFSSVVCDPPYALTSIVKRFGGDNAAPAQHGKDGAFVRASRGFMGMRWDTGDTAFSPEFWAEVYRVLKPGGHLLAFSGSRTYHRMAVGIEDAGFEIRDQIMWVFGSGFPKSHDVTRNIDKHLGAKRQTVGHKEIKKIRFRPGEKKGELSSYFMEVTAPGSAEARRWQGWGTALKPAHEPLCLARKPMIGSTAENVLAHGTGAINIDGCRVGDEVLPEQKAGQAKIGTFKRATMVTPERTGRWPANFMHDGLHEDWAKFFYCPKASQNDRHEDTRIHNVHPTVKPTELMRYLCRMITPPGGVVLDPFMGSGSTGKAAMLEGFRFVGIDMTEEYVGIAQQRIELALEKRRAAFSFTQPAAEVPPDTTEEA
jgi:DNA modification methylase